MAPSPMRRCSPRALPGLLLMLLLATQAQAQSPAAVRPDPLDPKAAVPSVRYTSAFAQYRRLEDNKPVGWREANDTVTRIGGWRVYTREAQQPDAAAAEQPAAPTSAPTQTPAPAPAPAPAAKAMPAAPAGHKH